MQIARFWWVVFAVLVAMRPYTTVQAYFEFELDRPPIQMLVSRSEAIPATASHVLALSDNSEFHHSFYLSSNVTPTASTHFSAADYLPLTEIATSINQHSISVDFGVEDILYANLRLVELINEYKTLQENAKTALEGLNIPYLQRKEMLAVKPPDLGIGNISKMMERVVDQSNMTASTSLPIIQRHGASAGNLKANFSNPSFNKRIAQPLPVYHPSPSKSQSTNRYHRRTSGYKPGSEVKSQNRDRREYSSVDSFTEYPWVIEVIIYLYNNKFLTALLFAFIYFTFWMISNLRKK